MNTFCKPSTIIALILFAYVLFIGGYILWWNQSEGGLVQGWYREYIDANGNLQGSGKWRLPVFFTDHSYDSRAGFRDFALLFGSWVYPFSVISSGMLSVKGFSDKKNSCKIFFFGCAALSLIILSSFLYLGIFRAVSPAH